MQIVTHLKQYFFVDSHVFFPFFFNCDRKRFYQLEHMARGVSIAYGVCFLSLLICYHIWNHILYRMLKIHYQYLLQ